MKSRILLLTLFIGGTTFFLRSIPFILFKDKIPKSIRYLGRVLPYGIMAMLIIYSLRDIRPLVYPYGLPELISILLVIFLHLKFKNTLLSIGGGTLVYMILIQFVFI